MRTLLLILFLLPFTAVAQGKYFTKNGVIRFESKAPMEDIESLNSAVTCVLDASTGALQFSVLIRGFEFRKALMQEHFNENYMESDKYPRAEFKGNITNNEKVNYNVDGTYNVSASGKLTIHNVTKDVQANGTINVSGGMIMLNSSFIISVADYDIKIPSLVRDKIAKNVTVKVDCNLKPLK
jgi:hypothetical protein